MQWNTRAILSPLANPNRLTAGLTLTSDTNCHMVRQTATARLRPQRTGIITDLVRVHEKGRESVRIAAYVLERVGGIEPP